MRIQWMIAAWVIAGVLAGCSTDHSRLQIEQLREVCRIVESEYYDQSAFDHNWSGATAEAHRKIRRLAGSNYGSAEVGAIRGLLESLGASHTAYYNRQDRERWDLLDLFSGSTDPAIQDAIESDSHGPSGGRVLIPSVGVILTQTKDWQPVVSDVIPGSIGDKAGIREGDVLLSQIRHVYWTFLSLLHNGRQSYLTFQRTEEVLSRYQTRPVPVLINPTDEYLEYMSRSASVIERDGARLGYVRIYSWAGKHYQDRLETLLQQEPLASADGIVLDIRGGWGGANPQYLDLFDAPMPTLTHIPREGEAFEWDPSEDLPERTFYWRNPVVLLVDGGTRSGKEIVAYAFKKHGIGPLVGERTAGAVLAGRPFVLSDDSLLYLAVADVLVDGERLEGVGVAPDIEVARDLPFSNGIDPQKDAALDALLAEVQQRD